jgi:hypothetical protein
MRPKSSHLREQSGDISLSYRMINIPLRVWPLPTQRRSQPKWEPHLTA